MKFSHLKEANRHLRDQYIMKWIDVPSQEDQGTLNRAVGRPENPEIPGLFGGHNLPPLVEIGLTDLPKSGGAMAPPAPPGTTGLLNTVIYT